MVTEAVGWASTPQKTDCPRMKRIFTNAFKCRICGPNSGKTCVEMKITARAIKIFSYGPWHIFSGGAGP